MFAKKYKTIFDGDSLWAKIEGEQSQIYDWNESTYIKHPPFLTMSPHKVADINDARVLALLGDSITTDHISPAGSIKISSPAGQYLFAKGVKPEDFNSYGSRRGNHELMMRGTFANIRLQNEMVPGVSGGQTICLDDNQPMSIYDAAERYRQNDTPLVVVAGKEYGTGSSRDWAAKGTRLLGVKAVIAESFERIHRSNLVGMGVLPLEFMPATTRKTLNLTGREIISIQGLQSGVKPKMILNLIAQGDETQTVPVLVRIDTEDELQYFLAGGILPFVLNKLATA